MFQRHGRAARSNYKPEQTKHWLTWLATGMVRESQTVFLIEKIQPTWLEKQGERIFYRIMSVLASGLIFGLIGWGIGLDEGLIFGLIGGLIGGLNEGLIGGEIKPIESLTWSAQEFKKTLKKMPTLLWILGLIFGLILWIIEEFTMVGFIVGLFGMLFVGIFYAIIQGFKGPEIEVKKIPNQGIKKSILNAIILGIIISIVAGLIGALGLNSIAGIDGHNNDIFSSILLLTILFCLIIGLSFGGGYAVIQHLTLRSMLDIKGFAPWNYARFLDYATELIFLQKVGGGYIFIHRMLLEHFAQVEPEQISESSVQVSQSIDLINASTAQELNPVNSEELETLKTVETLEAESVSNKICGNCQHENPSDFDFCSKCGTALNSDSISN